MRWLRALLATAFAATLTGCVYSTDVKVSGPAERPVVEISAARRGWFTSRVSIDDLTIYESGVGPVWGMKRATGGCQDHGRTRITYGVAPDGFRQWSPPAPRLVEGKIYSAIASGCGIRGGAVFKISAGRLLYVEGNGDVPRQKLAAMR